MATNLTRAELFSLFKQDAHLQLEKAIAHYPAGLSVWENKEGARRATGLTAQAPDGFQLVGTFKEWSNAPRGDSGSRTQDALDYLKAHPDTSVIKAARMYGITAAAIHAARHRRINKEVCPCCNQVVRTGFKIKERM